MPVSFKFYHDASLTEEITTGNPLLAAVKAVAGA